MDGMKLLQLGVLLVTAPWWIGIARRVALEAWRSAASPSSTNPPVQGVVRRFEFDTSSLRSGWDEEFGREKRLVNQAWLTGHRSTVPRAGRTTLESPADRIWHHRRRR